MKPKKDRCDICEVSKMSSEHNSEKYQEHIRGKQETHTERIRDRESVGKFVVCFDLQNVFALPLSNVSNFFYKWKLNGNSMCIISVLTAVPQNSVMGYSGLKL